MLKNDIPNNIIIIPIILPTIELGVKSPYPTVVIVTTTYQKALKCAKRTINFK